MVVGNPAFELGELQSFDTPTLQRICGYLEIKTKKKDKHEVLVQKIWDKIKPAEPSVEPVSDCGVQLSARLKLIQKYSQEGDKPNEW